MAVLQILSLLSLFLAFNGADAEQCNADNVLRALRRGGGPATNLCDSLIYYAVPTVTVVPPPGVTKPPRQEDPLFFSIRFLVVERAAQNKIARKIIRQTLIFASWPRTYKSINHVCFQGRHHYIHHNTNCLSGRPNSRIPLFPNLRELLSSVADL